MWNEEQEVMLWKISNWRDAAPGKHSDWWKLNNLSTCDWQVGDQYFKYE